MALNFSEKQHWKDRIVVKLNQRIAALRSENADLMDSITDRAYDEVISALGLTVDFENLNRIDDALIALEEEKETLTLSMQKKISGEDADGDHWGLHRIQAEIRRRQYEKVESLLREYALGRELEALKIEKEKLTDAVLLATSVQQIIELWDRVTLLTSGQAAEPEQETLFPENEDDQQDDDGE